jgi:prevent-host-death family protein
MTTVVICRSRIMREIQLRDAKASLSAVVDEAMHGKPAVITRHGKRQAVVIGYEEYRRNSATSRADNPVTQSQTYRAIRCCRYRSLRETTAFLNDVSSARIIDESGVNP